MKVNENGDPLYKTVKEPVYDENDEPVLDDDGNQVYRDRKVFDRFDNTVDEATGESHLKDLDYDLEKEDPGINGVKVELLNEYGNPVNRDGEVSMLVNNDKTGRQDRWVRCDARTGKPEFDAYGNYINADGGQPYTFTTETDYYGNPGYYVFSNLLPGKYRLRYTFPEKY